MAAPCARLCARQEGPTPGQRRGTPPFPSWVTKLQLQHISSSSSSFFFPVPWGLRGAAGPSSPTPRMKRMRLKFLLLVLGAVAAPRLSPSPLGLLTHEDPPKISCFAPRRYAGSTFELVAVGAGVPAQSVTAEPGQHSVEFTLDGAAASRCYRCRYRSYNGSAWQMSQFSTEIVVNGSGVDACHPPTAAPTDHPLPTSATLRQDPSWLLPVAIGAAVLVLAVLVVAALVAWRAGVRTRRVKRPDAPCWTEARCPVAELSYDNGAFIPGLNTEPESGTDTTPAAPQRHPWASPPDAPHFSTFKSSA